MAEGQPRDHQSIIQHIKYYQLAGNALKNYNNKFGLKFDVYRVLNREEDWDVVSWGPSTAQPKKNLEYWNTIPIFVSPTEISNVLHSNEQPLILKLDENILKVGDILKLHWVNDRILEFSINEQPKTFGETIFIYEAESLFNI